MYGDFRSNSAHPMALHARELAAMGHACAAAVPSDVEAAGELHDVRFAPVAYSQALAAPEKLFPDGRPADVVHAWTPREGVRHFVTSYLARHAAPWVVYLEDNEEWIARSALAMAAIPEAVLHQHTEAVISAWTPPGMPHVLKHRAFVGLADAAVVIQDKLKSEVPPWVPCTTVMPGVDLDLFAPRAPDAALRERYGAKEGERLIVYPGGLNDFTRPGLIALCRTVQLVNRAGVPCRLLRSGPVALDFLGDFPAEAAAAITDIGLVPRDQLPALLSLADVFVQPGKPDAFEDLRLPGKLPELLATGRPVVLPDANIAHMLRDGVDAVLHRTGTPEEIAGKCLELFAQPERARSIGAAGRAFADAHFDPVAQASRLLDVYERARAAFDAQACARVWKDATPRTPVNSLLASRLRWLAEHSTQPPDARCLLRAHAESIEASLARMRALETGMTERDEHIAGVERSLGDAREQVQEYGSLAHDFRLRFLAAEAELEAIRASGSWKVTAPLRALAHLISSFGRRP